MITNQARLEELERIVEGKGEKVLILTHNNPDPDAIAAGWALNFLLKEKFNIGSVFTYGGMIDRAENEAMVRLLKIDIRPLEKVHFPRFKAVALVDTQPGAGNNSLPASMTPFLVIDHHNARKAIQGVSFADIRPSYGSSATILTEYLLQTDLPIPKKLATALFYGIKADTGILGRDAAEADYQATIALYPHVQWRILSQIEYPELSREYFADFDKALHEAKIYKDIILCDLKFLINPSMVPLMADFLIHLSRVRWSFVMGKDRAQLIFSLRTKRANQNAGVMAKRLAKGWGSAGGHGMVAGGQIPLDESLPEKEEKMREALKKRFLKILGLDAVPEERLLPL